MGKLVLVGAGGALGSGARFLTVGGGLGSGALGLLAAPVLARASGAAV